MTKFDEMLLRADSVAAMTGPDDNLAVAQLGVWAADVLRAVKYAHEQRADDKCWMDIAKVYEAAGLPPPDASVGDPEAMLKNCHRYVTAYCEGGPWRTYAELEQENAKLRAEMDAMKTKLRGIVELLRSC